MAYLIGLAGGTGAGKTTIVQHVIECLGGGRVDLDSYYVDRGHLPPESRLLVNYDEPAAIDHILLTQHLQSLASGQTIGKPTYSFDSHTRTGSTPLAPAHVLIVDGLFPWWWQPVRDLLDLRIFVDAPADIRLIRRLRRDIRDRGRTLDHVLDQYLASVREMHERYVEPGRLSADLVVMNDGHIDEATQRVLAGIQRLGAPLRQHRAGLGR